MRPKRRSILRKLLSLNQHKKRWGARKQYTTNVSFAHLKPLIIDQVSTGTVRGAQKSIEAHLHDLRGEFAGQSELLWHHAKLVVMIRREFRTALHFQQFAELWRQEQDFLLQNLSIRWLISAADTFADHSPNTHHRALAMIASVLVNTVKIYETERFICVTQEVHPHPDKIEYLQSHQVEFFQGISGFTVGKDDTLRNMFWRLEPLLDDSSPGLILRTVWERLQSQDSAFARMRTLHQRKRTSWWSTD